MTASAKLRERPSGVASLLRDTLDPLHAYVPTPPQPGHRLHLNESPEDLPAELKAAALSRVGALDWSRYPEETELLAAELSRIAGWPADGILLGNGSNELLQSLVFATLAPGDAIVLAAPSFSLYATQAHAAGAKVVEVPLREAQDRPFRFDVDAFVRAARENDARLTLLASPNNPTGTPLTAEEVKALHDGVPGLLVIDEAYREFDAQDFAPLLQSCERLVLLRTFSKAFAAAALRMGWALAAPELCTGLRKLMMPYNFGAVSCAIARELLNHPQVAAERIARVVTERDRVKAALAKLPNLRLEESVANFVVFEHATKSARTVASELASRGVLVRDLSSYAGCGRCVRVSMGTVEANDAFVAAMQEVA